MKPIELLNQSLDTFLDKKTGVYRFFYPGGEVVFKLRPTDDHTVIFHNFRANPIGHGMGDQTLYTLCQLADQAGVTLQLTANPSAGSKMRLPQLIKWYQKHGFVENRVKHIMVRKPAGEPPIYLPKITVKPELASNITAKINWSVIRKNPVEWANHVDTKLLASVIKRAKKYYFEGNPKLSDEQFDQLESVLVRRQSDNPVLKEVGATPVRGKVKLPFKMPSLDKIRPDHNTLHRWVENNGGETLVMDKLDGNSLLWDGRNRKLYTRGDGSVGQDVSHLLKYLNLPDLEFVGRLELVLPRKLFEQLKKTSDNPDSFNLRNFVAGQINRKNQTSSLLTHAKCVFYEVIEPTGLSPQEQLSWLSSNGLTVVAHKRVKELSNELLSRLLTVRKEKSPYDIDGLVVVRNTVNKRQDKNPDYAFAFKHILDTDVHQVKVIDVEWNVSRHGKLKPVIILTPTKIDGVIIQRVTAHNAKTIVDGKIGPNAVVKIVRSGGVIPYLVGVETPTKPKLPDIPYKWNDTSVDLYTDKKDGTDRIKRITHFFTTLGVEGLREATVKKLCDAGFNTIPKILKMTLDDLLTVPTVQEKTATNILGRMSNSVTNLGLSKLMSASMLFGEGFSLKRCGVLVKEFPDLLEWDVENTPNLVNKVASVDGFSDTLANQFIAGLPKFQRFHQKLGISLTDEETKIVGNLLSNHVIVMTGFRNQQLTDYILSQGGKIGNNAAKATQLIVKDNGSESEKTKVARANGIPIYTLDDWSKEFKFKF